MIRMNKLALMKTALVGVALSLSALPIAAHATIYNFNQTGSNPSNVGTFEGTITVNGTLGNLPTVADTTANAGDFNFQTDNYGTPIPPTSYPNGYDFGKLVSLNIQFPSDPAITLNDFTYSANPSFFTAWAISPSGISYSDNHTSFNIMFNGDASSIFFITDASSIPTCHGPGCTISGTWTQAVPEPGSFILLASGLLGLAVIRRRKLI